MTTKERFENKVASGDIYDSNGDEITNEIFDFIESEKQRVRDEIVEKLEKSLPSDLHEAISIIKNLK